LLQHAGDVWSLVEADEPGNTQQHDKVSTNRQSPAVDSEDQITAIQSALCTLQTEFTAYGEAVTQMQAACAVERQAREALSGHIGQLVSLLSSAADRK
jgi:hypothetical protein